MEDLITYVAKGLVDQPEAVDVRPAEIADGVQVYELEVAESDLGLVIGRQGRTAKALRAVVRAAGAKHGERATLEIVE